MTHRGWLYFDQSLYFISTTQKNWKASRDFCLNRDADLLVINSEEEQVTEAVCVCACACVCVCGCVRVCVRPSVRLAPSVVHTASSGWGGCLDAQDIFAAVRENSPRGEVIARLSTDVTGLGTRFSLAGKDADWFFLEDGALRLNAEPEKSLDREVEAVHRGYNLG